MYSYHVLIVTDNCLFVPHVVQIAVSFSTLSLCRKVMECKKSSIFCFAQLDPETCAALSDYVRSHHLPFLW